MREELQLPTDQKALLVWDVFRGQMTDKVKERLDELNIECVYVPANMVTGSFVFFFFVFSLLEVQLLQLQYWLTQVLSYLPSHSPALPHITVPSLTSLLGHCPCHSPLQTSSCISGIQKCDQTQKFIHLHVFVVFLYICWNLLDIFCQLCVAFYVSGCLRSHGAARV